MSNCHPILSDAQFYLWCLHLQVVDYTFESRSSEVTRCYLLVFRYGRKLPADILIHLSKSVHDYFQVQANKI